MGYLGRRIRWDLWRVFVLPQGTQQGGVSQRNMPQGHTFIRLIRCTSVDDRIIIVMFLLCRSKHSTNMTAWEQINQHLLGVSKPEYPFWTRSLSMLQWTLIPSIKWYKLKMWLHHLKKSMKTLLKLVYCLNASDKKRWRTNWEVDSEESLWWWRTSVSAKGTMLFIEMCMYVCIYTYIYLQNWLVKLTSTHLLWCSTYYTGRKNNSVMELGIVGLMVLRLMLQNMYWIHFIWLCWKFHFLLEIRLIYISECKSYLTSWFCGIGLSFKVHFLVLFHGLPWSLVWSWFCLL